MFKEYRKMGFDVIQFTIGEPVKLIDNNKNPRSTGHFKTKADSDGMDYDWVDLSGFYLILNVALEKITLMDKNGESFRIPVRHFISEEEGVVPRMSLGLPIGWHKL